MPELPRRLTSVSGFGASQLAKLENARHNADPEHKAESKRSLTESLTV